MMQNLLTKAENIELKIRQMLNRLEMLKKENAFLKEENKNLVEKLKQQKGIIQDLELKSSYKQPDTKENLSETEKEAIKKEIDSHVDEINQVIEAIRTL